LATALFQDPDGSIFCNGLKRMIAKHPFPLDRVRYFQINFPAKHIVDSVLDEVFALGIQPSCLYSKMSSLGYSGPPMALICLDRIVREEPLEKDDRILSFVTEVSKFMQAGFVIRHV
jgi:3-oxoacyl-[acyl-carrier-protein] synthase III